MRFEGNLAVWHIDRGYGAVAPDQGGQPVFIHISAFPAEGPQPVEGERISFEIVSGRNNQKQASRVQRIKSSPLVPRELAPSRHLARRPVRKSPRPASVYLCLGLALVIGALACLEFGREDGRHIARLVSSVGTLR